MLTAAVVMLLLFFVGLIGARAAMLSREVEQLRRRLDALERRQGGADSAAAAPGPAPGVRPPETTVPGGAPTGAPPALAPAEPAPGISAPPAPAPPAPPAPAPAGGGDVPGDAPRPAPGPGTQAAPAIPAAPGPVSALPRPRGDVEQLVGGVWLQNAGAVLILIGFFFMIVWGYVTGRFGPGVLVAAGVLAGLGLTWRGARMRRTVRGVGHALIGVGAGVVWLSIWLGHFRLGVLPGPAAFGLVVLASLLTVVLGLRYRAQDLAALGVIGAHLPNLLGVPHRFQLPETGLLGYLAGLDAVVFVLAARAGWSALALGTLLLSAWAWIGCVPAERWSWPVEIGLAALFAGLGLAPVPRLARAPGPVRAVDLAVIAVAPLALLAVSAPMFQFAHARLVAILLIALAALYLAAALWVDARRPDRDLWRPLTAAAVVFLTAALERAVGVERTGLAWTLEGVALVLLGLAPRGAWLRACGYVVVVLGAFALLVRMFLEVGGYPLPVANASAVTSGVAIAALLFAAWPLHRRRPSLGALERFVGDMWFLGAHALLMIWLAREAIHLGWAIEGDGGVWRAARDVRAPSGATRAQMLFAMATSLAWFLQAAWLARAGLTGRGLLARIAALAVGTIAAVPFLVGMLGPDAWARDLVPLIHRDALLALAAAAVVAWTAFRLARGREALLAFDRRSPEIWAAGAAFMLLMWIGREADHLGRTMLDLPGATTGLAASATGEFRALVGTLTSAGWLIEALAAFVIGWWRRSAFLRWTGLALIGVTVIKFVAVDLASADPFWRFLTAIGAGAAMLVLSYVYQRSGVARRSPPEG